MCISTCTTKVSDQILRDRDPWVMRSVLDQQTRMVTLAFHKEGYAAYNTEKCALYKVWKGGVHWDGAAFNNVKTIQPESWGQSYWEAEKGLNPWRISWQGDTQELYPIYKGYTILDDKVEFQYELTVEGQTIQVYEQPELVVNDDEILFIRVFRTSGMGDEIEIINGDLSLPRDGIQAFEERFDRIEHLEKPERFVSGSGSQYWLDRNGCNTCHEVSQKTIGPSYKQIAARYEYSDEVIDELATKVKLGGSGVWGDVPMTPHPNLDEEVIAGMVDYILSMEPEDEEYDENFEDEEDDEFTEIYTKPGFGAALEGLHPGLELQAIRSSSFKPRVGGMDFLPDGRLLISTWDSLGAVYAISGVTTGDTNQINIQRIAAGLAEPLGLKVVDDDIYVLQKQELTQLIDLDDDGITDQYKSLCNSWDVTTDFHEFSYGLEYRDGYFYAGLGLAMRLMPQELQLQDRGTVIKISPEGDYEPIMTGLRQTNGIGFGPEDKLYVTENQGQWVPACKIIEVEEGTFHGCRYGMGDRYDGLQEELPTVWLPQDEIGNSPGQPVMIPKGAYQGQLLYGEVTHGGLKRVFLDKVNGRYQGVGFRFTQGLEAGIIRSVFGPDDALYVGGVGMNGNWGWRERQFGLQKLEFKEQTVFEILKIEAQTDGFKLTFTEPLMEGIGESPEDYLVKQWYYKSTDDYGGPKLDMTELGKTVYISQDRTSVFLRIDGLKQGHVVYFLLNDKIQSTSEQKLWTGEAWYTLNEIPG